MVLSRWKEKYMTAQKYMNEIYNAIGDKLINPSSIYFGRDGHIRLAREIGPALDDFQEKDQQEIVHGSYSYIYVRCCNLKPILDAKEWQKAMFEAKRKHVE